jgi:hypothetical protein
MLSKSSEEFDTNDFVIVIRMIDSDSTLFYMKTTSDPILLIFFHTSIHEMQV